jgi:hypothetical protein
VIPSGNGTLNIDLLDSNKIKALFQKIKHRCADYGEFNRLLRSSYVELHLDRGSDFLPKEQSRVLSQLKALLTELNCYQSEAEAIKRRDKVLNFLNDNLASVVHRKSLIRMVNTAANDLFCDAELFSYLDEITKPLELSASSRNVSKTRNVFIKNMISLYQSSSCSPGYTKADGNDIYASSIMLNFIWALLEELGETESLFQGKKENLTTNLHRLHTD